MKLTKLLPIVLTVVLCSSGCYATDEGNVDTSEVTPAAVSTTAATVYYRTCGDAELAGVTPLNQGDPGYRTELDRNRDGVACSG